MATGDQTGHILQVEQNMSSKTHSSDDTEKPPS